MPRSTDKRPHQPMFPTLQVKNHIRFPLLIVLLLISTHSFCQTKIDPVSVNDSIPAAKKKKAAPLNRYDSMMQAHSPRVAAIRSAILPGLGQIYNKKYWKLPIVYGALGTCAGIFNYNLTWYRRTRFAYKVLVTNDVASYSKVHPKLQFFIDQNRAADLQYLRNQYRRDIDYSALFFILLWGLNVVDATVDAHLKSFDVSPDLSLQVIPGHSELANTNGLSLVLHIGK